MLWESPETMGLQLFYKVENPGETFYYSYDSPSFGSPPTCCLGMSFSWLTVRESFISQMGLWAYSRASKKWCADYMTDSLIWPINRTEKNSVLLFISIEETSIRDQKTNFSLKKGLSNRNGPVRPQLSVLNTAGWVGSGSRKTWRCWEWTRMPS